MMPVDFTKFKRQILWDAVLDLCSQVTLANGYNTQPFVSNDPRLVQSSEEAFKILVAQGVESIEMVSTGGCMTVDLEIIIYGYSISKHGNPTVYLNKLIQDVRNTIGQNLGLITDVAGGVAMSFGDLETDSGVLTIEGMAAFLLPIYFTYKAGPAW